MLHRTDILFPVSLQTIVRAAMHASLIVAAATFAVSSSVMDPALFVMCVSILPHATQSKRITVIICILTLPFVTLYPRIMKSIKFLQRSDFCEMIPAASRKCTKKRKYNMLRTTNLRKYH